MRNLRPRFLTLLLMLALSSLLAAAQTPAPKDAQDYFFVLLRRPPNPPQLTKEEGEKLQDAHMANIRKLHAEHKLYVAGPFLDDTTLRGVFVFKADSAVQVGEWCATDPAIHAGRLAPEIHGPWLIDPKAIQSPAATEGLEQYTLVIIGKADGPISADLARQHASFLNEQKEKGNLAVAGDFPADQSSDIQGVLILRLKQDESTKIVNTDPLVKAGLVKAETHPWATGKGVLAPGQPLQLQ
jgi:uncharacterized protein YciI